MIRTAGKILLLCVAIVTTGCAAVVVGAGAGVGVYTYVKGELARSYPKDYDPHRIGYPRKPGIPEDRRR